MWLENVFHQLVKKHTHLNVQVNTNLLYGK